MTLKLLKKLDMQIISEIYNLMYVKYGKSDKIFQDQLKMLKSQADIKPILPADLVQRENSFLQHDKSYIAKSKYAKPQLQLSPIAHRKSVMLEKPDELVGGSSHDSKTWLNADISRISHKKPFNIPELNISKSRNTLDVIEQSSNNPTNYHLYNKYNVGSSHDEISSLKNYNDKNKSAIRK